MTDLNTSASVSSTQVITVADRSVKAVAKATAELLKVSSDLNTLVLTAENLTDDIQQKESQLQALGQQFEADFRTKAAELNIRVLENEEASLQVLMAKRDLATITKNELVNLAKELDVANSSREADIDKAVAATSKELNSTWGAKLATIQNAHAVETATLKAEDAAKSERITFLGGEIAALRKQIDDERNTRLEIAKADAGRQGVVVNAGKQ